MPNKNFKTDIILSLYLFLALVIFSLISFSTIRIKPNIFLVVPIVAGLLIESWQIFFGLLFVLILWLKFTPYLNLEYVIVFLFSSMSYVVTKFLIFGKILIVRILLVLVFQMLFWLVLNGGYQIISLVFLLEFIYNVIIEELLFAFGTWIKKRFS
jgi:hypothetical protein